MVNEISSYLIGMDCGTTNIKAVILSGDGKIIAEESRPSKFICPGPDMQEQDANEWWENAVEIFRSLAKKAGQDVVDHIKGIAISSHTVSMLPLDEDGNPVRNALTYQDGRSSEELQYILDTIGFEKFVNIVGGQPAVAFLPNKILWFKKHEPELFAKTRYYIQASSFINMKLTGVMTTDMDQASRTQCLDVSTMDWSEEIGNVIGVNLHEVMPPIKNVDEIIGTVTKEAAKETGLAEGIPVVAGCSDAMASMYATGLSTLGDVGESSGTSSLVFVGSKTQSEPDVPVVTKPCAIDGMPWIFDAPITTTGATIKWYIETLAREEADVAEKEGKNIYDTLNRMALYSDPGSNGVFFFPYLLGERAPLWNDHAKGMFIGMDMNTNHADLIRSVFEGTAYALRHVIETVRKSGGQADRLRICGGGAKSRTWCMIKASVLNMPVYVLDDESGDVPVGDALIAGHKVGVFPDLAKAVENIVRVKEVIEPKEEWVKAYDQLYPYFVNMYAHLDEDLKQLKKTMDGLRK